MDSVKIKLPVFEGPLDLLLHLVKINEMDIQEIRISDITEQYLAWLRMMESLDLEIAGDFLVMAATLINIKLRALLPEGPAEDEEDEEEIDDIMTAQQLMERLIEYRKFKEAASTLHEREQRHAEIFSRDLPLPGWARKEPDRELRLQVDQLFMALGRVARFMEQRGMQLVTTEEFSVEEKMDWIELRLETEKQIDVEEIFRSCGSKGEMIVCLLAMLELFHAKRIWIDQEEMFGRICLLAREPEAPAPDAEAASTSESGGEAEPGERESARIVDIAPDENPPS